MHNIAEALHQPDLHIGEGVWNGGKDWVTLAVERGFAEGHVDLTGTAPARLAVRDARELLAQCRREGSFRSSLPDVLEIVQHFPTLEAPQECAARIILEGGDTNHALTAWRAILHRFPTSAEAFRLSIRLVRRSRGTEAACAIIEEYFPGPALPPDPSELLMLGFGLEETGQFEEAEAAFKETARIAPEHVAAWRRLAKIQQERGALQEAEHTLVTGLGKTGSSSLAASLERLRRNIHTLESLAEDGYLEGLPMSISAINFIMRDVLKERLLLSERQRSQLGSIVLIGGSLGSGGAERQLVATALGLHRAGECGLPINGVELLGQTHVCVRSINSNNGNDFFAPVLTEAGVALSSYSDVEPYGGRVLASASGRFGAAIGFLPPRMSEGMIHLVDYLRDLAPDVVHIWQDGMIMATGLAALVAQVPRIVLTARTLPPTERRNRWKLELEPSYRALLQAPGVMLTANSGAAARAYERWLHLPKHSVPVIHNGVEPLDPSPDIDDERRWHDFIGRAGEAPFIVGTVIRIDENKRPFDWLDIAAQLVAMIPNAHFIMVGDGPLAIEAADYAARLGLFERVLFTGRSRSVGYWLSRMDAVLLTSRFEGTPNVLIEAQMAGVPVVTTPAGGAAETLRHGISGYVLKALETIDTREAADYLATIARLPEAERDHMREAALEHAQRNFAMETMLAKTVNVMAMDMTKPLIARA